jgi:hypothetical protein
MVMDKDTIEIKVPNATPEEMKKYQEIFTVLVASGTLNLKNAGICLHMDRFGVFQGIELQNYWPWRRVANGNGNKEG